MHTLIISRASRDLLIDAGCTLRNGGFTWVGCGWEIAVSDDVYGVLMRLSENPDEAIKLACTQQFGSA